MRNTIVTMIVNAALAVVFFSAVVVGWNRFFDRDRPSADATAPIPGPQFSITDWLEYAEHGHVIGDGDTARELVVFSDFTCSGCQQFSSHMKALEYRYGRQVGYTFRHLPLTDVAVSAARMSECADRQNAFVEMHDVLFNHRTLIGFMSYDFFATEAGIFDVPLFMGCMIDDDIDAIDRDVEAATLLGLQATPAWMYRGKIYIGSPGLQYLERVLGFAAEGGS